MVTQLGVARKDLGRRPDEQERVGALEDLVEERRGLVDEQRRGPSAALETAPAVLVRPAESLHHSVGGDVRDGRQFHVAAPFSLGLVVVRYDRTAASISSEPGRFRSGDYFCSMIKSSLSMPETVDEFRDSLTGDVLVEGDREYERARLCFNALIDRRPVAIARCVDGNDVAAALAYGQAESLEIAVRGGGHNPAGHCAVDDGLVIDLSRMRDVRVDPENGIATCQGGATWLDFDTATQAHGLVTPGGVVGSTGVTGLTLGGWIAHLTAH